MPMTADEVYVDPSALARLYLHQAGSREISAWRAKLRGALPVTHHRRSAEPVAPTLRYLLLWSVQPQHAQVLPERAGPGWSLPAAAFALSHSFTLATT